MHLHYRYLFVENTSFKNYGIYTVPIRYQYLYINNGIGTVPVCRIFWVKTELIRFRMHRTFRTVTVSVMLLIYFYVPEFFWFRTFFYRLNLLVKNTVASAALLLFVSKFRLLFTRKTTGTGTFLVYLGWIWFLKKNQDRYPVPVLRPGSRLIWTVLPRPEILYFSPIQI